MEETEQRGSLRYAIAGILNLVFLIFLNSHERWRPWFGGIVTPAFDEVLWAVNLGLVLQIFGNLILSVESTRVLRRIMEVVFSVGTLVGALEFYRVFPIDLSRYGDNATVLARVVFFLGVVTATMVIVVNVIRLLRTPELRRARRDDSHSGA